MSSLSEAGWQPIETAPKDGRDVLICSLYDDSSYGIEIGYWNAVREEWRGDGPYAIDEATHWMPLPNPPAHGKGE